MKTKTIIDKALKGARISSEEALVILQEGNLMELGDAANQIAKFKCGNIASYIIDRNINYTNICQTRCRFCAFSRGEEDNDAYVITFDELDKKIEETCRRAYRVLDMHSYARFDIRIASDDRNVYIIEPNANPCIARIDELAQSAEKVGISYNQIIPSNNKSTYLRSN